MKPPVNCLVSTRTPLVQRLTFVAKDNFATTQEPTTCSSLMLRNYTSPFTASAVLRLEAVASLVGKSNMDEFGMGSASLYSTFGKTVNPIFKDLRIAGGSSGGSAAAVASNVADIALGTDTGGSVRMPASYCAVVGFKPSYGRISRWGVVPYAQSFDTVGVMAKTVAEVESAYNVMDAYDAKDPTSMPDSVRSAVGAKTKRKFVFGVPQELLVSDLSSDTVEVWKQTAKTLIQEGHIVKVVSVPLIKKSLAAYYTLATAEAASNLSRYDGIEYGHRAEGADYVLANRSGFGPEVVRRIILGNYTLSSDLGDHLLKASQFRRLLVKQFNGVFKEKNPLTDDEDEPGHVDVLICPTTMGEAPLVSDYESETQQNFLVGYINDLMTVPASMCGLPAMSVPSVKKTIGIQLIGQYGYDRDVLDAGKIVEM